MQPYLEAGRFVDSDHPLVIEFAESRRGATRDPREQAVNLGLADVRNHLATPRLLELLKSEVFAMHGYTELYLDGRWVKATPAFNLALCRLFDVAPLEFDGLSDSVFHPSNRQGGTLYGVLGQPWPVRRPAGGTVLRASGSQLPASVPRRCAVHGG